jgi:hypothetical protein
VAVGAGTGDRRDQATEDGRGTDADDRDGKQDLDEGFTRVAP